MHYYPLVFAQSGLTRNIIWGGDKLKRLVPEYPADVPLAELWQISDWPDDGRVGMVVNGPLAGVSFRELIQRYPKELLGDTELVDGKFPLLIKLIDSREKLSVQVHPPQNTAAKFGVQPKAEAWLFLEGTDSNATIAAGFRKGTTQQEYSDALSNGSVEELLHQVHVSPGDLMNIPNGRVHAIHPGCLILEVQQNSNTTYRVFDYNRIDSKTGKPRDLHIEEALASLNFSDIEPALEQPKAITATAGNRQELLNAENFTVERFQGSDQSTEQTKNLPTVVMNAHPQNLTVSVHDIAVELPQYAMALLPAATAEFVTQAKTLDYVLIRPTAQTK